MKIILPLLVAFILMGCTKTVYVQNVCPTFDAELDIGVKRYDNRHAHISWEDVQDIKVFLRQKQLFNDSVEEMNKDVVKK